VESYWVSVNTTPSVCKMLVYCLIQVVILFELIAFIFSITSVAVENMVHISVTLIHLHGVVLST
jgi:hypothetical protein